MPRYVKICEAQMGPNQDGTPREAIIERMLALLERAPDGARSVADSRVRNRPGRPASVARRAREGRATETRHARGQRPD